MNYEILNNEIFGFVKPIIDIHTLGISTISNLLKSCGYKIRIATEDISNAVTFIMKIDNFEIFRRWVIHNNITRIGFSYRLDPKDGSDYFCKLFYQIKKNKMLFEDGGMIRGIAFAGLTDTCLLVKKDLGNDMLVFQGEETAIESLKMLGVSVNKFPNDILKNNDYDDMRWDFAKKLINNEKYKYIQAPKHLGYKEAGTAKDSYLKRLDYCNKNNTLPIIRAHVGPYNPNRKEAINEFMGWERLLANCGLLDVLSIGTSQLTQSNFGDNWDNLPNGGGVPINSENEFRMIKDAASPMLIRTYAGTKNIYSLAVLYEKCLNISWHALSFWWFCEIDGRGKNTVLENLKEHLNCIKYIASTGKPLEPNVPHHFAFRGADDITYILSAYLAVKTAKLLGIKHIILQNMLNTPKHTWGIQDLAKGRVMLQLAKELEDNNFKVSLQTRAGLDYFSIDLEKAKIQLAAVTALMDDLEPEKDNSPQIIHVVSFSEAIRLASPNVINESILITLSALQEYRKLRKEKKIEDMAYNKDLLYREKSMYSEAKEAILFLEKNIPNLYSAEGLNMIFELGFFPVPYLINKKEKYPNSIKYNTSIKNGGIYVVDQNGKVINTLDRYKSIL